MKRDRLEGTATCPTMKKREEGIDFITYYHDFDSLMLLRTAMVFTSLPLDLASVIGSRDCSALTFFEIDLLDSAAPLFFPAAFAGFFSVLLRDFTFCRDGMSLFRDLLRFSVFSAS